MNKQNAATPPKTIDVNCSPAPADWKDTFSIHEHLTSHHQSTLWTSLYRYPFVFFSLPLIPSLPQRIHHTLPHLSVHLNPMSKKAKHVPNAWDDEDWEVLADRAEKEAAKEAAQEPPVRLSKSERLALHHESNRKLWESAYSQLSSFFLFFLSSLSFISCFFKPRIPYTHTWTQSNWFIPFLAPPPVNPPNHFTFLRPPQTSRSLQPTRPK